MIATGLVRRSAGDFQVKPGAGRAGVAFKGLADMKWVKGRIKDMESERDLYKPEWIDIADYIAPRRSHFLTRKNADGRKRNRKIINSKATRSVRRAVAGFQSGMTPRTRPWFIYETETSRLERPDSFGERVWADTARSITSSILQRSNFYQATQLVYSDMVPFGTGTMQVDEVDGPEMIECRVHPIGSYLIDTDNTGRVDTFARAYRWTIKQIISKFGTKALSPTMQAEAKISIGSKHDVWNCIYPNEDHQEGAIGPVGKKWLSIWWVTGEEDTHGPLLVDGYHEFPIFAVRFWRVGEEAWGQSPGMDALPDVKSLQKETSLKMLGIEKGVLPAMKGPGSKKDAPAQTPGSYTAISSQTDQVTNLENLNFDLTAVFNDIEILKNDIADTFFEPLFTAIMDTARRQRTLGEVEKIESEKYSMLGPVLENIIDDLLEPVIARVYAIAERRKKIPAPPESIANRPVQIAFVSILAQAQKALEAVGVEQTVAFVMNAAQVFPKMRHRIDEDSVVERYADATGSTPILRSREDAQVIVDAEEAAVRQQEALANMQASAAAAKDASAASLEGDSALSLIADQFAGGRA